MAHAYRESGSGFCGVCDDMPGQGNHAPDAEGVEAPTPLQNFYLTFGVMYSHTTHPTWRWAHPDGHIKIIAPDMDAARELARRSIGLWYSFIYDEDSFARGKGMKRQLATIYEDGSASVPRWLDDGNAEPPSARFGPSDPQYYGRAPYESVCIRVEGRLATGSDADAIEKLGYEVEYIHHHCTIEGVALFAEVTEIDGSVQAAELDWANPHECPVCERSIT